MVYSDYFGQCGDFLCGHQLVEVMVDAVLRQKNLLDRASTLVLDSCHLWLDDTGWGWIQLMGALARVLAMPRQMTTDEHKAFSRVMLARKNQDGQVTVFVGYNCPL